MSSAPRTSRVAANTVFNYLGYGAKAIIFLISIPYIIKGLGNESYGIVSLTLLTIGYMEFVNLGMGDALIKYLSEGGLPKDQNEIINTVFFLSIGLGLVGFVFLFIFAAYFAVEIFKIPANLSNSAQFCFFAAAIALCLQVPLNVFPAVLQGLQRFDLYNKLQLLSVGMYTLVAVTVVRLEGSLEVFISLCLGMMIFGLGCHLMVVKRVLPHFTVRCRWFRYDLIGKLLRFGSLSAVGNMSGLVVYQCDVLFIGVFLPLQYVTFYEVGNRIASQIHVMSGLLSNALFPALSQFSKQDGLETVRRYFISSSMFIVGITLPVTSILFLLAQPFMEFWMGAGYQVSSSLMQVLAVAWLINSMSCAASFTSKSIGSPGIFAFSATLAAVVNVLLDILLIPAIGITGAVIATAIAQVIGVIEILLVISIRIGIWPFWLLPMRILKLIVLGCWPIPMMMLMIDSILLLLVVLIGYLIYYLWIYWCFILQPIEQVVLRDLIIQFRSQIGMS